MTAPNVTPLFTSGLPTFALERFAWEAPDRLEVSGWLSRPLAEPADEPTLVVHCGDGAQRLEAVPDSYSWPPEDGPCWHAVFAWQNAPRPFDRAELDLGEDAIVELPEPSDERTELGDRMLPLRAGSCAAPPPQPVEWDGTERLQLEAELLAAREELFRAQAVSDRMVQELARARDDLDAERAARAAEAQRFDDGLAHVQASAKDALAAEHSMVERLTWELREARAEIESLRFEAKENEHARGLLDEAQQPVADVRAQAERLLGHLAAVETALGYGD
jgi:hypothetical protein